MHNSEFVSPCSPLCFLKIRAGSRISVGGKRVLLVDTDPQASLVNALAASDQVLMVDSNLQRENILPSERAFAYKMKLEAIKHQGERTDLTFAFPKKRLR